MRVRAAGEGLSEARLRRLTTWYLHKDILIRGQIGFRQIALERVRSPYLMNPHLCNPLTAVHHRKDTIFPYSSPNRAPQRQPCSFVHSLSRFSALPSWARPPPASPSPRSRVSLRSTILPARRNGPRPRYVHATAGLPHKSTPLDPHIGVPHNRDPLLTLDPPRRRTPRSATLRSSIR